MKMTLYDTDPGKPCWIEINRAEALALIKSLVSQLQRGPNYERLESRCQGDATDLSIVVNTEN